MEFAGETYICPIHVQASVLEISYGECYIIIVGSTNFFTYEQVPGVDAGAGVEGV